MADETIDNLLEAGGLVAGDTIVVGRGVNTIALDADLVIALSEADATDLTDGGDTTLHYHASDRARANHTGTQLASTVSDFDTEVSNNTDVAANTTHRTSDGTDHTFIDQDVRTTASPAFVAVNDSNMVGVIGMKGSSNLPTGALWCDGSAVSRTTYADLFADIATLWGVGDGSTTFNLPDFNSANRFPRGNSTAGGNGGNATHLHTVNPPNTTTGSPSGTSATQAGILDTKPLAAHTHDVDIAEFNSGSTNNEPPYNNVRYFIWT